ncbi:MAG: beta-ketoacyl-[acyl-carrier-protein] synthase II [Caldilinea sp. CFX5]|nr:beta-ketoacyl-[acyl-carrier-protein] synthase II [Caldilinea sp. CFX5]
MTNLASAHHTNGYGPTRVVITGMGAITPLGLSVDETWQALLAGKSGIDRITRFDPSDLRTTFAAEVRNFDPTNYLERKEARRLDPYIQYAMVATQEALKDAAFDTENIEDRTRVGVVVGSGVGGIGATIENQMVCTERGWRKMSPHLIPNMLVDSAGGRIALEYGFHGPNHAVISACATGTSACGEAFEMIRRGDADVVVAGGAEAAVNLLIIGGFDLTGAMSQRNDEPQRACRPFDKDRDGFVVGEGSAILIMESEEHAKARGARIYAEVIGYGSSADAYSMVAPHNEGRGAIDAMRMAMRKAAKYGVQPHDIDYINAHGTSTRLNDVVETLAIKKVLGEHAYNLKVSSTKSMLGHLLAGAGAIETIVCAKTIQEGIIPPTINLENPDPDCDLDYTPLRPAQAKVDVTLSNSFGFGGHNASIMLRRYE